MIRGSALSTADPVYGCIPLKNVYPLVNMDYGYDYTVAV